MRFPPWYGREGSATGGTNRKYRRGVSGLLGDWSDLGSLERIAAGVRDGSLDPVSLVERALRRAYETARLNAVVHIDAEGARRAAAEHDRKGLLAGIPVLVKEIVEVAGWPFRCGSAAYEDRVGEQDADVVRRLRLAGAIPVGLTYSHEFAYGCTGTSNRLGPCRNPHDLSRMTGGSSAGAAAAVAAGVVPLAIGTDTAGSVRIPAALCGTTGVIPSRGTLPTTGVFPLSQTLDRLGVLTTTVPDATHALTALTTALTQSSGTTGRVGVVVNPEQLELDGEVGAAWEAVLGRLRGEGWDLREVRLPEWKDVDSTAYDVQGPEAAAIHAGRDTTAYQPDVQERLREAAAVPGWRYVKALARASELTRQTLDLLDGLDAIALPTVLTTAPPIDATEIGGHSVRSRLLRNTRLANLTGLPALTLPLPTTALPAGLQLLAATDTALLTTATRLEHHLHHHP